MRTEKEYKTIFTLILVFVSTSVFSQEMNTIISKEDSSWTSISAYGGPFIGATQLNKNWGVSIGGKGGFILNRKFAFGGIGMGTASDYSFVGNNLTGNTDASLEVSYGAGGVFVEYISQITKAVHFSVPLNLMVGGVSIKDSDMDVESSRAFILEPGVNLEFNLTKSFIPCINFSYRRFFGSSLDNLGDQDLSGFNLGLVFKFGYFSDDQP
ncbi:MAG: hypothetical protein ABJF11_12785 [Reichenbachiella sp.]|uniref:hypothetical protein n=1 Tax=Reichenbachiella sp. TaxID=2184521 RepID=UPI003264C988